MTDVAEADPQFATWMRDNLNQAAEHFEVAVTGPAVHGWMLRSVGAPVAGTNGALWLRVVSEQLQWAEGDWWTGNADADSVTGIRKPRVLGVWEWHTPGVRRQRAELMTYLDGQPYSPTDALHTEVDLPADWWADLRHAYDTLAATATGRVNNDQSSISARLREVLGPAADSTVQRWETVHGDLHWNNLLGPHFGLLDWELWGTGPRGTDPATLYCYSLLAPRTAARVWDTFADILDTEDGRIARLYVTARLLRRTTVMGDHPELEPPLREKARELLPIA